METTSALVIVAWASVQSASVVSFTAAQVTVPFAYQVLLICLESFGEMFDHVARSSASLTT